MPVSAWRSVSDVGAVAGCGVLDYGAWLAWRPLGFVLLGAQLIFASVFISHSLKGRD
jgi:hypothetical protein